MIMVIRKFPLTISIEQTIEMPEDPRILRAVPWNGRLYLWALVDPTKAPCARTIRIYASEEPMSDDPGRYIGAFRIRDEDFVFYAFDGGDLTKQQHARNSAP